MDRRQLDRGRLHQALTLLGEDLSRRGAFVELAVYGGSALMMQFEWRHSTEDVDAVVRGGFDETLLAPSVARVAETMGLTADWLNNSVGMFTPLDEPDELFQLAGSYPEGAAAGLRIVVARPHYLLAMKLKALESFDRGDRDLEDARALAAHLGMTDITDLLDLYVAIHDEPPPDQVRLRLAAVLGQGRSSP
ncbi:hypothetical protein [Aurantimonas sp. VKM B-3413]|uniref:hypothetical protein n=1 Tax=Aurantimonas sp. VKM B-3413 TaxID=2779401 RepID=UPI001E62EBBC|nr:hypothetical protein [Aurantimonas sp. VKM B-3413]MCB8838187.1 hypothetical protein [Aurantimonas sp. VKM B-3413]